MPILGSSNSTEKKISCQKYGQMGIQLSDFSRKPCGKRRNCSSRAISSFPTMFSKAVCC